MAPLIRTTLAPVGRTPVLRPPAKHRQKVSVAAALIRSPHTGHVRLVHETFADHYVDDFFYAEFLRERVVRGARRPIILVHDGAPLHHGLWTQEVIEDLFPRLSVYEFPPYAPELNPVEHLWTWAKREELANFIADDLDQLLIAADYVVRVAKGDQHRLQTFFDAAALPW